MYFTLHCQSITTICCSSICDLIHTVVVMKYCGCGKLCNSSIMVAIPCTGIENYDFTDPYIGVSVFVLGLLPTNGH